MILKHRKPRKDRIEKCIDWALQEARWKTGQEELRRADERKAIADEGIAHYKKGEWKKSLDCCEKAMKLGANTPEIWMIRGTLLLKIARLQKRKTKLLKEAVRSFDKHNELEADRRNKIEGFKGKAMALWMLRDLKSALAEIKTAIILAREEKDREQEEKARKIMEDIIDLMKKRGKKEGHKVVSKGKLH